MAAAQQAVRSALRSSAERLPDVFAPEQPVLVGFSAGQDSTALLHALTTYRPRLKLIAAHIDHGLRPESAGTAERVAALARDLGVDSVVRRVDVAEFRRGLRGWSIQQAARAVRYQALAASLAEFNASCLLVAHTADDQAETLLLHLVRGSGLAGLAGMRLDETLTLARLGPPVPGLAVPEAVRVARPLLRVARTTTLAYCTELGLPIVEDPSNTSRAYTRNRVRLDLLPALAALNPAIGSVLARTAELVGQDLVVLDNLVAGLEPSVLTASHADALEYDLAAWRAQPRALQRRLLRRGLERLLGDVVGVSAAAIEDSLDLVQSARPGQAYHLPYGIEVCMEPAGFSLRRHGRATPRSSSKNGRNDGPRV
jgi:tRNA(Ile)-lysidine synthase